MLPKTQIQEELSRAYIYSVASKAGYTFTRPVNDYDSIDVIINAVDKPAVDSIIASPSLEIQAKATYVHTFSEDVLSYPLKVKNYNDLRKNTMSPRILVVYLMPREEAEWVVADHDELKLRTGAYWVCLKDMPDTDNADSITVKIPKTNIFNHGALHDIMVKASKGESLINAL